MHFFQTLILGFRVLLGYKIRENRGNGGRGGGGGQGEISYSAARVVRSSPKETDAFKAVVSRHAEAILGTGRNSVTSSGWASLDVNRDDPVEVALAARLQHFAIAHVAGSTSKEYVGPWNKFVKWCGERLSERCPLPASNFTVALFLQSVADGAKTFAPVKSHSAAIAFFQNGEYVQPLAHPVPGCVYGSTSGN